MECPVCTNTDLPDDFSTIDQRGRKVICRGRIYAIIDDPSKAGYSPFGEYFTVSLYPRKGKVKYLKFKTKEEMKQWSFERDSYFNVYGCMHEADNKDLIFNLTRVEPA